MIEEKKYPRILAVKFPALKPLVNYTTASKNGVERIDKWVAPGITKPTDEQMLTWIAEDEATIAAKAAARTRLMAWFTALPIGVQVALEPAREALHKAIGLGDFPGVLEIVNTFPLLPELEYIRAEVLGLLS
jgi:hypothetical protein